MDNTYDCQNHIYIRFNNRHLESTEDLNIIFIIAVGTAGMTLLAGFIIFFIVLYQKKSIIQRKEVEALNAQHQQDLLHKTIEVEANERERIAKNIHDDLGALISILRLNNSRSSKNIGNQEVLAQINESNSEILTKTSETLRSISKKLASPTLNKLGFIAAIREICSNFNQTEEISVSFENLYAGQFNLPQQKASHLFRACQEIINNIIKHASASKIVVQLLSIENRTLIKFEHNGIGIGQEEVQHLLQQEKGLGLGNIQNRLAIIGAEIEYSNAEDVFATILITYENDDEKN